MEGRVAVPAPGVPAVALEPLEQGVHTALSPATPTQKRGGEGRDRLPPVSATLRLYLGHRTVLLNVKSYETILDIYFFLF